MFKDKQKVIYRLDDDSEIEASVMGDPGSTLTTIMYFNPYPHFLTVDNNRLIDYNEWVSNNRDNKLNKILDNDDINRI